MTTKSRWKKAIGAESSAGEEEQEAFARVTDFNPQAAAEKSAQGAFASFSENLNERIRTLRENQVGTGRIRTGWATQGEDELVEGMGENLTNELARNSLQAAGMEQQNRQFAASSASQRTGRFYDMLSGTMDRETAEANRKRKEKSDLVSGIASLLGGGVGALFGGTAGASAGARIGGTLGGVFS